MKDKHPARNPVELASAIIVVIAAIVLFLHLSSTDIEFSRYNPGWNGTSVVFDTLDDRSTVMVGDLADLEGARNATLLVIAPARAPTAEEGAAYRNFATRAGNTLILADDFGSGNELLEAVGARIRLDRSGNLSSLARQFEVSNAPIGYPVEGRLLVTGLSKVVFNHPVAVIGGDPLINTTYLSWIDRDGDGRINQTESLNRFTVAAEEAVGAGRIVVIGDASLFINAMQGLPDCDNGFLIERLTAGETFVEQRISRTAGSDGTINIVLLVRQTSALVVMVTTLSLCLLAWSLNRWRR